MRIRPTVLVLPLAIGLTACADSALSPTPQLSATQASAAAKKGSGIEVSSLTDVSLPLVGPLGTIDIEQAVITNFAVVENVVGAIVGVEVNGVLDGTLTLGATGMHLVGEQFTSDVRLTSSGPGQCSLVTLDLSGLKLDALRLVTADVDPFNVTVKGSGAVGSLLCNLGQALSGLTNAIPGLVNALNNQI